MDGDLEAADRAIRRAVERAPNDADILAVAAWMGPGLGGIYADANAWADRALALNPAAPGWYLLAKGTAAFGAGDYEAAVEAFRAAPPGFAERPFFLAAAHAMLGDAEAARAAADELRAMLPGFDLDLYVKTWPDPGLRQRLHDGAVRAGLGGAAGRQLTRRQQACRRQRARKPAQYLGRLLISQAAARKSPALRRPHRAALNPPGQAGLSGADLATGSPREPSGAREP